MNLLSRLTMLGAALSASCAAPRPAPSPHATGPALPADVHAIATLARDATASDLAPVRDAVGDADIVGIGETNHGSEGFHDAEGRLIAYLVRDLGFRAVGFELGDDVVTDAAACVDTSQEVARWGSFAGAGNARTLEWICGWNRTHPTDAVRLFGTDVWLGPEDMRALATWATTTLEPQEAEEIVRGLRNCFGAKATSGWRIQMGEEQHLAPVTATSDASCVAALDRATALAKERGAPPSVDMRTRRLRGHQAFYSSLHDLRVRYEARDEAQFAITLALREARFSGLRAVLLGHTHHIGYCTSALQNRPFVSLGERLRSQLGDRYRAIAVSGFDVRASRVQGQSHYQHDEPSAVEREVHELGLKLSFVDFHKRAARRLIKPGLARYVGFDEIVPSVQFQGLVVVDSAPTNRAASPPEGGSTAQ